MKNAIILLLLVLFQTLQSQTVAVEFGDITIEDFERNEYPNADAVVLYDKGKSTFHEYDYQHNIRFKRHRRIKVNNKKGESYSEISIPFYTSNKGVSEEIKELKGVTYNVIDGQIRKKKLDPSTIYSEKINKNWTVKKFVMPDIQKGSVFEFTYTLETPFKFNLPDWDFQSKIPTLYSECQVSMIPFYEYIFRAQRIGKFDYSNVEVSDEIHTFGNIVQSYSGPIGNGVEYHEKIYTWAMKDVPPFESEEYITSPSDYIQKIDFQLSKITNPDGTNREILSTWEELNKALIDHEYFGKFYSTNSRKFKAIVKENIQEKTTQRDQAYAIIQYVKNNYEWDGYYRKYASQTLKNLLESKKGSSSDLNLLLLGLLKASDIPSSPVILSSRDHGKMYTEYPFDFYTNCVIVLIDLERPFLTDATEEYLPNNRIPTEYFNEIGLIVSKDDKSKWVQLESKVVSEEKNILALEIDEETMEINAQVSIQSMEYQAFRNRHNFKNDTTEIKKHYSERIGTIGKILTSNFKKVSKPYILNFKSNFETTRIGKTIILKPFLNLPLVKNSLTSEIRTYPVDFIHTWEDNFSSTLKIPEDYIINTLPEGIHVSDDMVEISLSYDLSDNTLSSTGKYRFKKAVYEPDEYLKLKDYLNMIVKAFNQEIILEKSE